MSMLLPHSIYLSIYFSIYLSICLSNLLSTYLFIYLFVYLSIHLSLYLTIYQSMYLSINLSMYLSIYLCIYLSISIYLSLSVSFWFCRRAYISASLCRNQSLYLPVCHSISCGYLLILLLLQLWRQSFISSSLLTYLGTWRAQKEESWNASTSTFLQVRLWFFFLNILTCLFFYWHF